jgi:uncharacterized glyoxalase superfamily protein PhnB
MKFASARLVTRDVAGLAAFYARLTGAPINQPNPQFAEVRLPGAVLAISGEQLIQQFNAGAAKPAANQSAILEFEVDDVDAVHDRISADTVQLVMAPTNQPWGNRSMLLRDPDGNLINIFARLARAA